MADRKQQLLGGVAAVLTVAGIAYVGITQLRRPPSSATEKSNRSPASYTGSFKEDYKEAHPDAGLELTLVLAGRYDRILSALPARDDLHPAFLDEHVGNDGFMLPDLSDVPLSDADSIVAILQEPLRAPDGSEVVQAFDSSANTWISGAGCTIGSHPQPVITYNPQKLVFMRPGVVRFLKMHEMAHIQLHVHCGASPPLVAGYREKDADCWAVPKLLATGAAGNTAILQAAAFFSQLGYAAEPHGPYETSSVGRGVYLERHCT